ncbi:MAG: sensor histidine kinase [Firmicutes bacterium]|nr:sensor histidine kinase [Bacillota bacterium]
MTNELFIRHALELTICIPAAIMAYLPVRNHVRFKWPVVLLLIGGFMTAFILIGADACVRFNVSTGFILLPLLLLCFEVFTLTVQLNMTKKIFCFLNACMLCFFTTVYSVFLTAPVEPDEGPFTIRSSLICVGITFLILLFFYRTLAVKLPYLLNEERLNRTWWAFSLVLVLLCAIFIYINPQDIATLRVGRVRSVGLVGLALYPLALYLIYHLFWWTSMRLNENAEIKQENTVLSMEQKRYEELRSYMDETRTLRHDFRQHIRVITELTANGEFDELKDYVKQFTDILKKGYTPFCANMAVDAVASHYASLAEAKNIKMQWDLRLPKVLPIPEIEFCAMLGNLLENALKATENVPEEKRRIDVVSSMLSDTMLGLTVDNPYIGKIRFDREHLPVSREPGHGFGMPSVAATVKRYNGTMDITTKDGIFSVSIMLYPPKPAETSEEAGSEEEQKG